MSNNPPAFQFYANDWLSSPGIMLMTPAEEGAYIRLLAIAWEKGGLPDDDEQLAVLSRLGEGWFNGSSTKIRAQFVKRRKKLVNLRQEIEREKQKSWREKSRQGGVASAKARKDNALQKEIGATTGQPPLQPKGNTPTPTPTPPSLIGVEKKTLEGEELELKKEVKIKALWFTDELAKKFRFKGHEPTTFARMTDDFCKSILAGDIGMDLFDLALVWADEALAVGEKPKAMFMAKVKQETGYEGRGMVLRK